MQNGNADLAEVIASLRRRRVHVRLVLERDEDGGLTLKRMLAEVRPDVGRLDAACWDYGALVMVAGSTGGRPDPVCLSARYEGSGLLSAAAKTAGGR